MRFSSRTVGLAAAVVTVLIWTAFIVIARASAQRSLPPFDIAFLRIVGASAVLMPWALWRARQARAEGRFGGSLGGLSPLGLGQTALLGVFGGLAYAVLAYGGFFFAPAAHGSVLMPGSLPLWASLLSVALLGERFAGARLLGLGLIVLGDLMVGGASLWAALSGQGAGDVWKGDLLFMAASSCWATYSVLVRREGVDAVRATMAVTAFALVSYVPVYALLTSLGALPSHLLEAPVGEVVFQLLFQGVGSVVISGITFTRMIQHFGPVRSTMITALVPGLSALGAVALLGEPLVWNLIAGLALVTLGIACGVRARPQPLAPTSPLTVK
ncbi:DMT family transporter [Curvibacter sp. RS43]|uniref:DMT family transporter n=1 Tax=Curvibacter microcysteis TaxID=3026419 RepID=UPI0023604875|nr:DMT family transporter [Curvibacter sp. RS43]MDD0810868.1 DMT family transporter [Curvibacter sp. RS43]